MAFNKHASFSKFLINRIKNQHELDQIEIYHFRNNTDFPHSFLSYKDIKELKQNQPQLLDKLDSGVTVVLARNSQKLSEGICSVAICSQKEQFNKSKGLEIALRRLHNYLSKPNDNSWDYNETDYMSLNNLPTDKDKIVDEVSKRLNQHPYFIRKGYKVFNAPTMLKY